MKTNQIMIRDFKVEQRTSDYFFNATSVINYWNLNNPSERKEIAEYSRLKSTKEFIEYTSINEGIEKPYLSSNKGTWMHPHIFIDFAMWVSIEFKSMAIKWILDGLIKSRHEAGDYYNEMTAKILEKHIEIYGYKPNPKLFLEEARLIKDVANINKPRNEMSEAELAKVTTLQKINTTLISDNVGRESRKRHLMIVSRSI